MLNTRLRLYVCRFETIFDQINCIWINASNIFGVIFEDIQSKIKILEKDKLIYKSNIYYIYLTYCGEVFLNERKEWTEWNIAWYNRK